jgi:hypothetical protein
MNLSETKESMKDLYPFLPAIAIKQILNSISHEMIVKDGKTEEENNFVPNSLINRFEG